MSVKSKSVLVTGGAGFIGSHLVDRLVKDDPARITVVDNFFLGSMDNLAGALSTGADIEIIRMDAGDLASMQDVVERRGVDTIFDLAVIPLPTSLTYPAWTVQTNVAIPTTLSEIARRGLIDRFIHVSSSEAYGSARYIPMDENHPHDALTPYAASKSAADHIIQSYVHTFGIDATIIRPFNNIGPRQNSNSYAGIVPIIIGRVLKGEPIEIYGDGEQTRDLIFVRNTADVLLKIYGSMECRGEVLNVATGVETTMNELVQRVLHLMDSSNHPIVHTGDRPGDVRRHLADVSKLHSRLGTMDVRLTDDELAETIDWYRSVLQ